MIYIIYVWYLVHNTRYINDTQYQVYIWYKYQDIYTRYILRSIYYILSNIYIYIYLSLDICPCTRYICDTQYQVYIWYGVYNIRYIYMNIYCQDIIYFEVHNIIYIIYMHPPRAACERGSMRIPLACCLLLFLLFFDFDLEMVCFILVLFCCGYIMLSPRLRFLLRLVYR